jgi:Fe2+ transport system protein B
MIPNKLGKNVDEINKFIVDSILNSADKAIPVYKINNSRRKNLPNYKRKILQKTIKTKNFTKRDSGPNLKTRYNKLTAVIREEIDAIKHNEWNEFVQKLGKNPTSTKPFWQRINNIRGNKTTKTTPTLVVNNTKYETDEQKANLFFKTLTETFSSKNNPNFDNVLNNKDLFDVKDLNFEIKKLNKRSSNGEDKIHNRMIQNTSQEFRKTQNNK